MRLTNPARILATSAVLVALAAPAAAAGELAPTALATKTPVAADAEAASQPTSVTRRVTIELNIAEVFGDGDAIGCGEIELRHETEIAGAWDTFVGPGFISPLTACTGGSVVLHDQPMAKITRIVEATPQHPLFRYRLGAFESDGFWGGDWAYSGQFGWDAMSAPDGETSYSALLVNAAAGISLRVQFDVSFETL